MPAEKLSGETFPFKVGPAACIRFLRMCAEKMEKPEQASLFRECATRIETLSRMMVLLNTCAKCKAVLIASSVPHCQDCTLTDEETAKTEDEMERALDMAGVP